MLGSDEIFGGFFLSVWLLFIGIIWLVVPFAIFGTKRILKGIQQESINHTVLLQDIRAELKKSNGPDHGPSLNAPGSGERLE